MFMWVGIVQELDGGKTQRNSRILINTEQICSLNARLLSMADAETYTLTLTSTQEVISRTCPIADRPPDHPPVEVLGFGGGGDS